MIEETGSTAARSTAEAGRETDELREALGELPDEQRRALLLAALFGYTAREIGAIEQIPLGTAKTRIRSAMQKVGAGGRDDDRSQGGMQ